MTQQVDYEIEKVAGNFTVTLEVNPSGQRYESSAMNRDMKYPRCAPILNDPAIRKAIHVSELSDKELAAIAKTEAPSIEDDK